MIGPFFVIHNKIYACPIEDNKGARNVEGKLDASISHKRLYQALKKRLKPLDAFHPYEYWPRGRVVFNQIDHAYEIYLDACIKDKPSIQDRIAKAFCLEGQTLQWRLDSHYLCHRCNPNFVDID